MRFVSLLRSEPHYRSDAFQKGAVALGYKQVKEIPHPTPDDLLITWNRYGHADKIARTFTKAGARVLVAENCYLGNDFLGDRFYAISNHHHNGAGYWPSDNGKRWRSFGYELSPYKELDPKHPILGLAQRSIGPPGVAMPTHWPEVLRRGWDYPAKLKIRRHPGRTEGKTSLSMDLKRSKGVITWGSGAAIKALAQGYPCISTWAEWIGHSASSTLDSIQDWDHLPQPDRIPMFESLANAIWRLSEIESGEAFERLLYIEANPT